MDDAPATGRTVDIELGGQEVITIDLDQLDPDPTDVLDLLNDSQVRITVWAKIIGEYWRRGYLDAAEKLGNAAVEGVYPIPDVPFGASRSIGMQHSKAMVTKRLYLQSSVFLQIYN